MNQNRNKSFLSLTSSIAPHFQFAAKRLWTAVIVALLFLTFVPRSEAGFKTVINGISVSYSSFGADAYIDSTDGTLTVAITQDGGNLNIIVGPTAYLYWSNFVDVYILADTANLKSIKIRGAVDCTPFVVGQVNDILKFTLQNGVVGNTDYYGQDFGLGIVSTFIPLSISLKNSYATAQMFGYANPVARAKPSGAAKTSSAATTADGEADVKDREVRTVKAGKKSLIQKVQGNIH